MQEAEGVKIWRNSTDMFAVLLALFDLRRFIFKKTYLQKEMVHVFTIFVDLSRNESVLLRKFGPGAGYDYR